MVVIQPIRPALNPLFLLLFLLHPLLAQPAFRVVTYNVENYLVRPSGTRTIKSPESRAKVVEGLVQLNPDVIALQEIGDRQALADLQSRLKQAGLDLPHAEHVGGFDTNIFVAVLSRHPFIKRQPHTNASFLLNGRRFRTSRGIAEVEIEVRPGYRFTLLTTHLKSKRTSAAADESDIRLQEAQILREKIDAVLQRDPDANIVVCGDFNDTHDTAPLRTITGRGVRALIDSRPAERNGDSAPAPRPNWDPRRVTWTHHFGKEDSYSRIDYILLSRGMAREWERTGTYVLTLPDWGVASDHRPLVAEFIPRDR
jgi:endonuclease/exonuclease/phosphatase family metal-dependent hydrolase